MFYLAPDLFLSNQLPRLFTSSFWIADIEWEIFLKIRKLSCKAWKMIYTNAWRWFWNIPTFHNSCFEWVYGLYQQNNVFFVEHNQISKFLVCFNSLMEFVFEAYCRLDVSFGWDNSIIITLDFSRMEYIRLKEVHRNRDSLCDSH